MVYLLIALFIFILFISYMIYLAHHDTIDYSFIHDERLPAVFDGFRVFFISDIHRRNIKLKTLQSISIPIDIVVIGGDLTETGVPFERVRNNIEKLKQWNAPLYFVWGNNDYETDSGKLHKLLVTENVSILANDNRDIIRGEQTISLLGLDCCRYQEARIDLAQENANGNYSILVTHAPSAFYELDTESQDNLHTVLAGHTHGGQIRIMGFGLYRNGGLRKHRKTNVFVSEGYGYTQLPFRLGTKAECHILTFKKNGNNKE